MRTIDEAKRQLLFQSAISDYYFGMENGIYKPGEVCKILESFIEVKHSNINIHCKFPLKVLEIYVDSEKKLNYKKHIETLTSDETLSKKGTILNHTFFGTENYLFDINIHDYFNNYISLDKILYEYKLSDKITENVNGLDGNQFNPGNNVPGVNQNVTTTYVVNISSQGAKAIQKLPDGIYLINHIYFINRIPVTRIYKCNFDINDESKLPFSVSDIIFYPESVLDHDSEDEYFKLCFDSRNIKMRKDYEHVCTTEFSSFELVDEKGYYLNLSELIDGIEEE